METFSDFLKATQLVRGRGKIGTHKLIPLVGVHQALKVPGLKCTMEPMTARGIA